MIAGDPASRSSPEERVHARVLDDPDSTACGALFDEFNDPSIDADLAGARPRRADRDERGYQARRQSATLDSAAAKLLGDAPVNERPKRPLRSRPAM